MSKKIKVALAGVGNCASSLVQGVEYYKDVGATDEMIPGLMHNVLGGYKLSDIEFVAAFDVDKRKVGTDLSKAVFSPPNCTTKFSDVPKWDVELKKGPVLDGVGDTVKDKFLVDPKQKPVDVKRELEDSGAEVCVCYLPVGSEQGLRWYAQQCMEAGIAFINAIPVFIQEDVELIRKFEQKKVPVIGSDIKSQVGATIVHRVLTKLFVDRGQPLMHTYQLNVGGNSVTSDQMILLNVDGRLQYSPIGDFIDDLIDRRKTDKRNDGKEILPKERFFEKIKCFTVDNKFQVRQATVDAFIRHKLTEPLFEIELDGGRKIKITKDHNVFVLNDNGELQQVTVGDLKEGKSFIAVPENLFSNQKELKSVDLRPYFKVSEGFLRVHNHPEIRIPARFPISDEFLQIVGMWLADGSYDRRKGGFNVEIACGHEQDCVKVIDDFCKSFNISYKVRGKKRVALRILSKTLGRILKTVFGLRGTANSKRLPSWTYGLSERQIAQVLKGYVSGDGGVTGKQIRWTSISEHLIRDIQTLFLRIGINSTLFKESYKPNKRKKAFESKLDYCWHGIITSNTDFKLFKQVGFIQKEKNKKFLKVLKDKKENPREKFIPQLPALRKDWKIKSTTWWRHPQVSANIVLKQIDKIKNKQFREKIYNICAGGVKFLKVKRIKRLKNRGQYVYDLSVKPYERFICSNILVHNTDFQNMLMRSRLKSKKISKTNAVQSQLPQRLPDGDIHVGPSDHVPWLKDNKVCFIRMEGKQFGDVPMNLELRLSVEDSPNSAGVIVDAIRCAKLALDRGVGGMLLSPSAYFMKSPPIQYPDSLAKQMVEEFIRGERER